MILQMKQNTAGYFAVSASVPSNRQISPSHLHNLTEMSGEPYATNSAYVKTKYSGAVLGTNWATGCQGEAGSSRRKSICGNVSPSDIR